MRRKIIKQANQAYTITLPIGWVRDNGLEAGGELDLKINEKSISLHTNSHSKPKKVSFNAENLEERTIINSIKSFYAQGIDEIIISSSKNISESIIKALNNVIGFALISENKNEYVIKEINSGDFQHIDEIFKRVFQIILAFYDSAINDVFGPQKENLDSMKLRDIEVNKFCLFLQRAINKSSYSDAVKSRAIFTYSFALEKISDEIERFWRANIKYKPDKPKELKLLAEITSAGLGKAFEVFYQSSPKLMEELYTLREKARDKTHLIKVKDPQVIRLMRHLVKIIEDAADLNHLAIMLKN